MVICATNAVTSPQAAEGVTVTAPYSIATMRTHPLQFYNDQPFQCTTCPVAYDSARPPPSFVSDNPKTYTDGPLLSSLETASKVDGVDKVEIKVDLRDFPTDPTVVNTGRDATASTTPDTSVILARQATCTTTTTTVHYVNAKRDALTTSATDPPIISARSDTLTTLTKEPSHLLRRDTCTTTVTSTLPIKEKRETSSTPSPPPAAVVLPRQDACTATSSTVQYVNARRAAAATAMAIPDSSLLLPVLLPREDTCTITVTSTLPPRAGRDVVTPTPTPSA